MHKRKNCFYNSGFTLIELLVVIAIIGLLASVILVSLNSSRGKARDAKRIADIRQIMTALELYFNDNLDYPAATGAGQAAKPNPTAGNPAFSTYLSLYPTYPTPIDGTNCAAYTGYAYARQAGPPVSFTITFCIGAAAGGLTGNAPHTAYPTRIY